MIYQTPWTQEQFAAVQRIARRHDIRCPLRIAMVTRDDKDGQHICACNGKLNQWGQPKTTPRERTLADVLAQLGLSAEVTP